MIGIIPTLHLSRCVIYFSNIKDFDTIHEIAILSFKWVTRHMSERACLNRKDQINLTDKEIKDTAKNINRSQSKLRSLRRTRGNDYRKIFIKKNAYLFYFKYLKIMDEVDIF